MNRNAMAWSVMLSCAALSACGGKPDETPVPAAGTPVVAAVTAPAAPLPEPEIVPTIYPPPVRGRIEEINVGNFALVDGLAYPAADGSGTVVYAVSKAIASPVLSRSACPRLYAESLAHLRDAGYAEVTLDADGKTPYFLYGHAYDGSGRSLTPTEWRSDLESADGKVSGKARHKYHGEFEFELPLGAAQPAAAEADDSAAPIAVYERIRAALKARDLAGVLAAQGFDAESIAAIRGLPGIDEDLQAFATRFLEPGTPSEGSTYTRGFYVAGSKPDGKQWWNYYGFARCGDALVMNSINEMERD